jgi:hypothetical protein
MMTLSGIAHNCRAVRPIKISQFCSLLTSSRVFQGLLWY